jgi:hypothetical protein
MTHSPADKAIAYAATRGTKDGRNAAEWYLQDVLRSTRDGVALARILQGIEDGDPEITDSLPSADLSGQWADSLTGPALVEDAIVYADDWTMGRAEWVAYWAEHDVFTDVCDAYETAYADAVESEVSRVAKYHGAA